MIKNVKYCILFLFILFVFCSTTVALTYGGCEYSKVSRLKKIVSNVNVSYDYHTENQKIYFNVTINNIVPGIYFIDSTTGIKYNYNNSTDGEIIIKNYTNSSGNYKFYSELSECYGITLGTKYYKFPSYNRYYESELCQNNPNYNLCQKWQKNTYSYSEFEKMIQKYNEDKQEALEEEMEPIYKQTYLDVLIEFYIQYYYIILIGIIVTCLILMVINKKKNSFDL